MLSIPLYLLIQRFSYFIFHVGLLDDILLDDIPSFSFLPFFITLEKGLKQDLIEAKQVLSHQTILPALFYFNSLFLSSLRLPLPFPPSVHPSSFSPFSLPPSLYNLIEVLQVFLNFQYQYSSKCMPLYMTAYFIQSFPHYSEFPFLSSFHLSAWSSLPWRSSSKRFLFLLLSLFS